VPGIGVIPEVRAGPPVVIDLIGGLAVHADARIAEHLVAQTGRLGCCHDLLEVRHSTAALTAQDVAAASPSIEQPTLGITSPLTAQDIATGAPSIEQPTLGSTAALSAQDIATGSPSIEKPTLGVVGGGTSIPVMARYYRNRRAA